MQLPDASVLTSIPQKAPPREVFAGEERHLLSPWSRSRAKRLFDIAIVVAFLPVILPVLLAIDLAVRLTSRGPVIFRQTRIGRCGREFIILKFRTMVHAGVSRQPIAAVAGPAQITWLGRILRWLKLDELPQVLNVLRGEMSLVGPRPRVSDQQLGIFSCRPGITGPATLAFAREDLMLAVVPEHALAEYYMTNLLPVKERLDREYMARATCLSDLLILARTLLRRWDSPGMVKHYAPMESPGSDWLSPRYHRAEMSDGWKESAKGLTNARGTGAEPSLQENLAVGIELRSLPNGKLLAHSQFPGTGASSAGRKFIQ